VGWSLLDISFSFHLGCSQHIWFVLLQLSPSAWNMLIAHKICWGTASLKNSAQWRIPSGFGILPAVVLGFSILLFPESPRYAYRNGRVEEARLSLARINGVDPYSPLIDSEIYDMEEKLQIEREGGVAKWSECFTGEFARLRAHTLSR
jgi:hypothetical protein